MQADLVHLVLNYLKHSFQVEFWQTKLSICQLSAPMENSILTSDTDIPLCGRRMSVKQKDVRTVEKFKAKLAEHAKKIGGVFVHYDADTGTWLMKVNGF